MNIIVVAWGHPKKFNVPHGSQNESNDDNASGEFLRGEKLTDREKVCDARKRQRGHEVRPTPIVEVA
jgi:hypothetical protein